MLKSLKNTGKFVADITHIEEIMMQCVKSRHENVEETLKGMITKGGKRLRPLFLVLCAGFGEEKTETLYEAAAGIEMVHMATLIHDDIIDEAVLRRGQVTAQYKFGKDYAVFMGDFLMNRSFMLLNGKDYTEEVLCATEKVFFGEMLQYNNRYVKNTSVTKYLRVAANKTASLFELACYLGAKISGCDEELSARLRKIGYYFGLFFQITDDVLDFTENEKNLGKDVRNDMKMGFYTLPVIYTAREDVGVWELMEREAYDEIASCIKAYEGLEKTIHLARRYINKANNEVKLLPDIPEKKIVSDLILSVNKMLNSAVQTA